MKFHRATYEVMILKSDLAIFHTFFMVLLMKKHSSLVRGCVLLGKDPRELIYLDTQTEGQIQLDHGESGGEETILEAKRKVERP